MKKYKINDSLVEVGSFQSGTYQEYDEDIGKYKDAIAISYKQNDESTQGVGSGGNKQSMSQYSQGRREYIYDYTIKVYDNNPYKGGDKVFLYENNKSYLIEEVLKDGKHPNNILNIAFPSLNSNKPRVLVLKSSS